MKLVEQSCADFTGLLASKNPVPGGGGAAALVAAFGVALGTMVCNFTFGKRKYAEHEARLKELVAEADLLQQELLGMVDEDAQHFLPLSRAYGLPADTDEEKAAKAQVLEGALKDACGVPMRIIRTCHKAIGLHADLVDRGSRLVISDVGVGVQCLRAAIISGQLNVLINLKMIQDAAYVDAARAEMQALVREAVALADAVYAKVEQAI